jgi:hypothetical protein
MLVQQQSLHSLDLTDLDLDQEEDDQLAKKKKEDDEAKRVQQEEDTVEQKTFLVNEVDQFLDLLEIF